MSTNTYHPQVNRSARVSNPTDAPDRIAMFVDGLDPFKARQFAVQAVEYARSAAPKLSGESSRRFAPIAGTGYFGIAWEDRYVWFQNQGLRPRTMWSLAGKTIPMWINDPDGKEASKNPKAKTRVTASGRRQTLIFRRAAKPGQRKLVKNKDGTTRDVPASYPGAPGRIARREPRKPWTTPGRVAGQIARNNVGVRWRHPGTNGRHFMEYALNRVGRENQIGGEIHPVRGPAARVATMLGTGG